MTVRQKGKLCGQRAALFSILNGFRMCRPCAARLDESQRRLLRPIEGRTDEDRCDAVSARSMNQHWREARRRGEKAAYALQHPADGYPESWVDAVARTARVAWRAASAVYDAGHPWSVVGGRVRMAGVDERGVIAFEPVDQTGGDLCLAEDGEVCKRPVKAYRRVGGWMVCRCDHHAKLFWRLPVWWFLLVRDEINAQAGAAFVDEVAIGAEAMRRWRARGGR